MELERVRLEEGPLQDVVDRAIRPLVVREHVFVAQDGSAQGLQVLFQDQEHPAVFLGPRRDKVVLLDVRAQPYEVLDGLVASILCADVQGRPSAAVLLIEPLRVGHVSEEGLRRGDMVPLDGEVQRREAVLVSARDVRAVFDEERDRLDAVLLTYGAQGGPTGASARPPDAASRHATWSGVHPIFVA